RRLQYLSRERQTFSPLTLSPRPYIISPFPWQHRTVSFSHEKAVNSAFPGLQSAEALVVWNGGSFHENSFIGHSLSMLCPERRRSLAGRSESGVTEDSGGRGRGSADKHHGHNPGRW